MKIYCGVDIIEIERIKKAIASARFLEKVYTPNERAYLKKRAFHPQSAAGLFAAKEAVSKALGTGIGPISFQDIEIFHDLKGKPSVRLSGAGEAQALSLQIRHMDLSISHNKTDAIAFATALGEAM